MLEEKRLIATVTSLSKAQPGQKHRSSGNFSTENVPGGFSNFYWEISGIDHPESIKFNVMKDVSAGTDTVVYENLKDGSVTSINENRRLYIADPKGADGSNFTIKVYVTNY